MEAGGGAKRNAGLEQGAQVSKAMMKRQNESYPEIPTWFVNTDHVAIPKGIVSLHVHKYA